MIELCALAYHWRLPDLLVMDLDDLVFGSQRAEAWLKVQAGIKS